MEQILAPKSQNPSESKHKCETGVFKQKAEEQKSSISSWRDQVVLFFLLVSRQAKASFLSAWLSIINGSLVVSNIAA
jgi:hypothetical protein